MPRAGERITAEVWRRHPCWGAVPPLGLLDGSASCRRLVVVAAHPDDESLGAGGLIATAHAAGILVYVVLLTAGESARSLAHLSRHALATQRLAEVERAVDALAPGTPVVFLGAADGRVSEVETQVVANLEELLGDGRHTLLAAPWRLDGHPDHDAAGRAAAEAARRTGARLAEYPLWSWELTAPDDAPWSLFRKVDLSSQAVEAKERAIAAHASRGRSTAHFSGAVEHFVVADDVTAPTEPA